MWASHVVANLVPMMGILMIIAVVIGPIWIRSYFAARDRAQMHETLRTAYEKGQPVPPELIASLQNKMADAPRTPDSDLRRALVLIGVGLGLAGLGWGLWWGISMADDLGGAITGGAVAGAGAIPGMIGVGYLILWLMKRDAPKA